MDRHHLPPWPHRAPCGAPDRDRLIPRKDGDEPRLGGRLDPSELFPAGVKEVRSRWITLPSGIRLRVAEAGVFGQPPVLLMHGWGASLYMWRDWFVPLAATGRHAIAVDLPGHGLSDKPDETNCYRLESLAAIARELLSVEGLSNVDVVAQSMAGTIALELATAESSCVRRLVLVNPACFGRVRLQALARLVSPSLIDAVLPRLVTRWLVARAHRMVYSDPSRVTRRDIDEYWAPSQFPSYARAMRRLVHEFDWERPLPARMVERLRSLRAVVMIVLGSRDRLVLGAAQYVSELRAAGAPLEVCEIANGGHAVNEERPDEIIAITLDFLCR